MALQLCSCTIGHQIGKQAKTFLLQDSVVSTGFTGICIYEPATKRYLYQHNAQQYFTPASNVKLFTLYAAMKYLGDSLPGLKFVQAGDSLRIYPTADPTLLHPDFIQQPVFHFLAQQKKLIFCSQRYSDQLGKGWSWDDYLDNYMLQRSELPLYGNQIRMHINQSGYTTIPPHLTVIDNPGTAGSDSSAWISRRWDRNTLYLNRPRISRPADTTLLLPLVADLASMPAFLSDTLRQPIEVEYLQKRPAYSPQVSILHSRPTDSLLIPMMHSSDNFFAEQSLLMVSNEQLGWMSTDAIIDTLLKKDLAGIPQRPTWVDGSGLSRYNLFTPASMVFILDQLQQQFGTERLKRILPTGGQGTLQGYFLSDSSYVFAKTGTLSGTVALSGILITKNNKLLVFSVLTNNFKGRASRVRRAIEHLLQTVRNRY